MPVVGDLDSVSSPARPAGHGVVAVCRAPGWGPARLHRPAWQLEGTHAGPAVDPGLMEIADPRMHIIPVEAMPLLRLSHPRFTGVSRLLEAAMDRSAAAVLLLISTPVFLGLAIAVRLHDGGPVFSTQERVDTNGRTFRMIKFRSMGADAEKRLATIAHAGDDDGPPFNIRRDPHVTAVGKFLRTYPLDELPQLLNVLNGTMSLVGPRPPLAREVATYTDDARRRVLVRPGMTGLWQVSGSQHPDVGAIGAARPELRRELVPRPRPGDHLEDVRSCSAQPWRLLSRTPTLGAPFRDLGVPIDTPRESSTLNAKTLRDRQHHRAQLLRYPIV